MLVVICAVDTGNIQITCTVGPPIRIHRKPFGMLDVKTFVGTIRVHPGEHG